MKNYIVGITGASGSIYGIRCVEEILKRGWMVHLVITKTGEKVMEHELGLRIDGLLKYFSKWQNIIRIEQIDNLFASIASGSFNIDGMIISPCSMSTLGEIANGITKNLLTRAADVCIKEKRKLVIVPRETPINSIHLKNMLILSECGVIILPPSPGFYHQPETVEDMIDFIVGKTLDLFNIENNIYKKWGKQE